MCLCVCVCVRLCTVGGTAYWSPAVLAGECGSQLRVVVVTLQRRHRCPVPCGRGGQSYRRHVQSSGDPSHQGTMACDDGGGCPCKPVISSVCVQLPLALCRGTVYFEGELAPQDPGPHQFVYFGVPACSRVPVEMVRLCCSMHVVQCLGAACGDAAAVVPVRAALNKGCMRRVSRCGRSLSRFEHQSSRRRCVLWGRTCRRWTCRRCPTFRRCRHPAWW
jgi:hypothetical protein